MKAMELAESQKGCWRNIAITLITPQSEMILYSLLLSPWPNVVSVQPLSCDKTMRTWFVSV